MVETLSIIVGLGAVLLALGYFRLPFPLWSLALVAALGVGHGWLAGWVVTPTWLGAYGVWLGGSLLLGLPALRRPLLSGPILALFRKAMPTLSQTEREALEAGTVWWERALFSGRPDWRELLDYSVPALTAEEQAFLDGPTEALCRLLDDWQVTHESYDLPPAVWAFIKENGFFGLIIPKEYGGRQFSAQAHSAVVMKIASRSLTGAVTVMVPNSLGPAELLLKYGAEEQKAHYLPRLARGEEVPCFALTSPYAGSDAGSMPDQGVVCRDTFEGRDEVLGIRVSWNKRYITLAPVATVLGLAFKLHDPDHLLGERESLGITVALIPTSHPGVHVGPRLNPLDVPFQNGPTWGEEVFIPMAWVIGGAAMAGQGWRMLMECLAEGRSISLPALSTGGAKLAARVAGAYARVRRQFKLPVGRFEGVQEPLARIAGNAYLMEAARSLTAVAVDRGERPSVISALVKRELTERMRGVINDAMDVVGGAGISMGPRNPLGRIYQGVPIGITVEGANILTRSMIVFGQGAMRAHPYLLDEVMAVGEADRTAALEKFDRALFGHIGFVISNLCRAFWLGISGCRLTFAPLGDADGRYFRHLTRISAAFALAADFALLILGGGLKRREFLSGRFADVLSALYLGSALLKRFYDDGRPREDLPLLDWGLRHCLHQAQEGLMGIYGNFPLAPVGGLLKWLSFPWGRSFDPPDDRLTARTAGLILGPCAVRERLTAGIHLPTAEGEFMAELEQALKQVVVAEPVEEKLKRALRDGRLSGRQEGPAWDEWLLARAVEGGIITAAEVVVVQQADAGRMKLVQVDHFDPDYITSGGQRGGRSGNT